MSRLALVCALLGVHGIAESQPRYPRPQPVSVIAAPVPQVRPAVAKVKAVLDVESVLSLGRLVGPPRAEQEQILVSLIEQTPDTEVEEKSDYLFRLAELYGAQMRTLRTANPRKSNDALLKSVKMWKALVENDRFRNYPKIDAALFEYGYTLQTAKYMKEARNAYDKLLKDHPQSTYVPQAHLVFANYYDELGQSADAEARFRMVLKFPQAPTYAYALYRTGRIHHSLQRYQEALETFFQVVAITKDDAKQHALDAAAKEGFVEAYVQIGKTDKALLAFKRVDANASLEMVEMLAGRHAAAGKQEQAVYLYQELIKAAPTDRAVCRWQVNVVTAMLAVPTASAADKAREVENLVKLNTALEKAKTLPPEEAAECREQAQAMSKDLARALQAQPAELGYAEKLYRVRAEGFPEEASPSSFADLLWTRAEGEATARLQPERWAAAADAYLDVARTAADPQKAREAATLSVLAWKNGLAVDPRPAVQAGVIDLEAAAAAPPGALAVPPTEAKLAAAFAMYERSNTDRDELARTKFLRATLHRRHGDHAMAVGVLTELLAKYKDHETAELAANLLLDSLIRMQRFDDVLAAVDQFSADAKFLQGKPGLQANIKLLRSRSLRRR